MSISNDTAPSIATKTPLDVSFLSSSLVLLSVTARKLQKTTCGRKKFGICVASVAIFGLRTTSVQDARETVGFLCRVLWFVLVVSPCSFAVPEIFCVSQISVVVVTAWFVDILHFEWSHMGFRRRSKRRSFQGKFVRESCCQKLQWTTAKIEWFCSECKTANV